MTTTVSSAKKAGDEPENGDTIILPRPATRAPWMLIAITLAWIVPGLFGREPWKPDEGYTIGLVKHIVDSGDWIVPNLVGLPFLEKPPLFFATSALFGKALPFIPLHQAMAAAAAFYIAVMLLFAYLGGREVGGPATGGTALLGLLGCVGLLVRAHSAITDTALWCGFAVAGYGMFLTARRGVAGAFWFGVGAGLAFMAKGLQGPAFLGVGALLLPLVCPARRNFAYVKMLALSLLFSLPWVLAWPIALYMRSPELFHDWFWLNNVGRFLGTRFGFPPLAQSGRITTYLEFLPWFTLPLWPPAVWLLWRQGRRIAGDPAMAFSLIVFLGGFILLSAASTRRDLYLIPLLVPLAFVAATAGVNLPRWLEFLLARAPLYLFGFGLAVIWAVWIAWRTRLFMLLDAAFERFAPGFSIPPSAPAVVMAMVFTLAWFAVFIRLPMFRRDWAWVWALGITAVWGTTMFLFLPLQNYVNGYRGMFGEVAAHLPAERSIARLDSFLLGESQRAILEYYYGWRDRPVSTAMARTPPGDYYLVQGRMPSYGPEPEEGWGEMIWRGARPGDDREIYTLYRKFQFERKNGGSYLNRHTSGDDEDLKE